MADLAYWQLALIGLVFIWSGFVRSGLGFGGAVLALPFLLLILNEPLVFLPLISVHLLIFSSWITLRSHRQSRGSSLGGESNICWSYLRRALLVMLVPKLIGVFGLLTLPGDLMTGIIFGIVSVYALTYIFNKPFVSRHPALDTLFLVLGGYVSGTSLIGAPLIVAVFANHVPRQQLRDTLFVLWFILVAIKMVSFLIAGVDLQLIHHLWLLPCAWLGHLLGERFHQRIQRAESPVFFRIVGFALLTVCSVGFTLIWWS